jgi:hypothetical protein
VQVVAAVAQLVQEQLVRLLVEWEENPHLMEQRVLVVALGLTVFLLHLRLLHIMLRMVVAVGGDIVAMLLLPRLREDAPLTVEREEVVEVARLLPML